MENLDNAAKANEKTPRTIKDAFNNLEGVVNKARDLEVLSQSVKDNFDMIDAPKGEEDPELKKIPASTPNMVAVIDNMAEKINKYLNCTKQNLNYLHQRLK